MTQPSTKKREVLLNIIELYKDMPYLWDKKHKDYNNKDIRNDGNKVLLEVYKGFDSNVTVKNLVKKIQNLRTGYFKELKKVKESSRTGAGADEVKFRPHHLKPKVYEDLSQRLHKRKRDLRKLAYCKSMIPFTWLVIEIFFTLSEGHDPLPGLELGTLPLGILPFNGQEFDYIVVGAGAAGTAVASRLSMAGKDVLLIEAGGNPTLETRIPGATMALMGSGVDWYYKTIPNNVSCLSSIDQQCRYSHGKCLGGSTSINYMMYVRGSRNDFDTLNITGWTWKDMKPYFFKYEGLENFDRLPLTSEPYHNTEGLVRVGFFEDPKNDWHGRMIGGYTSLNLPYNEDVNALSQIGVSKILGYVSSGERVSTARAYLTRKDVKKNLKLAKNTFCTGVIIDRNRVAKGVTVKYLDFPLSLKARKEVILSAGGIATPQILMLSGIGPADHLRDFKIPVRINLNVGDDMSDHVFPLLFIKVNRDIDKYSALFTLMTQVTAGVEWLTTHKGSLASNGLTDVTAFVNTKCYDFHNKRLTNDSAECELPTLQLIHGFIPRTLLVVGRPLISRGLHFNNEVLDQLVEVNKKYAFIVMSPVVLQPASRGTVRLASADPLVPPAITPNYLQNDTDVDEMVRAINFVEDLLETPQFRQQKASLLRLNLSGCIGLNGNDYWRCYSRHMTYSVYHAVGTAALGRVLDEELRVIGIKNLRVADASAMPNLPRGNTAATVIAYGERLADILLKSR
ncbi:unnamed protein product [Parnassius apollo]|uniref:(apollo) hypothetical protein n=1 Tax=Parnassius apollo TaxID=110799 RepID=A0A8S3Y3Y1_PARAO|nr:unnamed protein product [Parnassius apollo]